MNKTAFIGHRQIFTEKIEERLENVVKSLIESGCKTFTMGVHGKFDSLALSVCKQFKNIYKNLEIELVLTSLHALQKYDEQFLQDSVKSVMYEIEDIHFKQQITVSNRKMLETCDTLVCYVDTSVQSSGAKSALRYAEKIGLKIINLHCDEDKPFYGLSDEDINKLWNEKFEKFNVGNHK